MQHDDSVCFIPKAVNRPAHYTCVLTASGSGNSDLPFERVLTLRSFCLDMLPALHSRSISQVWQVAISGMLVALPVSVILGWVLGFETDGLITVIGAVIAGGIAVTRSVNPSAAGLRTGLLGASLGILFSLPDVLMIGTESAGAIPVFIYTSGFALVVMSMLGWVFGRLGGWVTNTLSTR
ncbi:hypothetical protein AArc1_2979 [Natrarchaeobaculum sulfurireducens]|uniref:Uncharacterized protein n=2 Tax=Natrarchaeobaculum sulfurireducens TaxID=2044521 RepID=A0A346PIE2_9EURY|nr:hypothetical protein AArc1_2979 [Natrarchaeobaculum sulfurireducens]